MRPTLLVSVALTGIVGVLGGCATTSGGGAGSPAAATVRQADDSYYVHAHDAVAARIAERKPGKAKNVILFVGDGMGVSTITAGRIWAGQAKGVDGESYRLAMETLPYTALSKTYTHDSQVADSAPTATAMTTGVKSWNGTLGVTQGITKDDCATAATHSADSLWEIAEAAGKATGVISTARLTHATPGATYAKTNERDWEADVNVSTEGKAKGCTDIASQFIAWQTANGDGMEVAMAGGRAQFLPNTVADPEYPQRKGLRADGRNLMTEWTQMPGHVAITDEAGFKATNFDSDVKVLGLFEPSHMEYEHDRPNDKAGEPSLAEMTRAAITRLKRDPDGFVLMVEGGRIDHAHHAGNALRALSDVEALDEAVQVAREMTGDDDTLIIVTADHSHTLTISGYPGRNNPILGLVQYPGHGVAKGADGKPYTTLGYMNGPGAICTPGKDSTCERKDLTDVDTGDEDFLQQSLVPLGSETHGGEDVAVFASGPGSSLLTGTIEENEIFHVMARSLGLVK